MGEKKSSWRKITETEFEELKEQNKIGHIITLTLSEPEENEHTELENEQQEDEEKKPVGRPEGAKKTETIHFRVEKERKEDWQRKAEDLDLSLTKFIINKVEEPTHISLGLIRAVADSLHAISQGPYHGRDLRQFDKRIQRYIEEFAVLAKHYQELMEKEQELLGTLICGYCGNPRQQGQTKCACGWEAFKFKKGS